MPSLAYSKRKGATAEVQVAEHARSRGFCHAHRKCRTGAKDEGDVLLNELVTAAEVKNTKAFEPSAFLKESVTEAAHAGSPIPAGVWKVPRKPVGEWLAFLPYDALLDLLQRAEFPTGDDSLWRELWSRATDDVVTLVEFIRAQGLEPPHVSTRKEAEVAQS